MFTEQERRELLEALGRLSQSQREIVRATIMAFGAPRNFWRATDSDVVTADVMNFLGDRLVGHHASSRQALSKDRFEYALEASLQLAGIPAELERSRTNRGHDIIINGIPVSLKTEAAAAIKQDSIHVSKWMELGKGAWELPRLRDLFLEHMQSYDRIFTLRCLRAEPPIHYELVEIPKALMQEAAACQFQVMEKSKQNPKPGRNLPRQADISEVEHLAVW